MLVTRTMFDLHRTAQDVRIAALEKRVAELTAAFDKWFDLVAPELGFEAAPKVPDINVMGDFGTTWITYGISGWEPDKTSPRQVKEVKTEKVTVIRTKPAICKKKAAK